MLFEIGQVTLTRNKDPKSGFGEFFGCLRLVCYQGIEWDRLELKIEKCITRVTLLLSRELLWACVWAASRPCTFPSWFLPHCCSASTVVFDLRSNLVVDSSLHRSASCLGAIDPRNSVQLRGSLKSCSDSSFEKYQSEKRLHH